MDTKKVIVYNRVQNIAGTKKSFFSSKFSKLKKKNRTYLITHTHTHLVSCCLCIIQYQNKLECKCYCKYVGVAKLKGLSCNNYYYPRVGAGMIINISYQTAAMERDCKMRGQLSVFPATNLLKQKLYEEK